MQYVFIAYRKNKKDLLTLNERKYIKRACNILFL